jgi:hypothetical protein
VAAEELKWRHVADSGWLAADVSVTQAVDQRWTAVHWSTVDRPKGHTPDLIWTVQDRSNGWRGCGGAGGGRRAVRGGARLYRRRGLLTVKICQPSHEFTFGVGISFIPYLLVLTPVV